MLDAVRAIQREWARTYHDYPGPITERLESMKFSLTIQPKIGDYQIAKEAEDLGYDAMS